MVSNASASLSSSPMYKRHAPCNGKLLSKKDTVFPLFDLEELTSRNLLCLISRNSSVIKSWSRVCCTDEITWVASLVEAKRACSANDQPLSSRKKPLRPAMISSQCGFNLSKYGR